MYGFVYETTNLVNGKKYIGQKNYDDNGTWKRYLGSGVVLSKATKKYGKENFSRVILEECETAEELNQREKYWIRYFNADKSDAYYNIAAGGDGGNVVSGYSEEKLLDFQKRRIAAVKKSHLRGEDAAVAILTEKQVLEIIERLKINEFPSDIARDYNVSPRTISDIRLHKSWTHLTADIHFDDISKRKRPCRKEVVQYDKAGNFVKEYASAREAEKETGIGYKLISAVCHGDKLTARGFVWRLKGDAFNKYPTESSHCVKVDQYDRNGAFIKTWNMKKDVEQELGIRLNNVLYGRYKTAGGYCWAIHKE